MSPKSTDLNQAAIMDALRRCGCKVQSLHTVGDGCPDLLCLWHGLLFAVEVKNGSRSPSAQKLTEAEIKFHEEWSEAPLYILNGVESIPHMLRQVERHYDRAVWG